MLHQLELAVPVRNTHSHAIAGYLDYCVRKGLSVGAESARGFVADALRRGLAPQGVTWKAALNWFFREGRKRSAPRPEGVPAPAQAGTGNTAWESRLIERLRLKHYPNLYSRDGPPRVGGAQSAGFVAGETLRQAWFGETFRQRLS